MRKQFPNDPEIPELVNAVRVDQEEQRKLKGLAEARDLVAAKRYDDCIALLGKLQKEFPGDANIPKLLETASEEQKQQIRQQRLAEARNLLAARTYDDCDVLLAELRKQFPEDGEVRGWLRRCRPARKSSGSSRLLRMRGIFWPAHKYDESIKMLAALGKEFPADTDIPRLLQSAVEEQRQQIRQQRIAEARNLLAARKYDECGAQLADLRKQFPEDAEVRSLAEAVRAGQEEQRKLKALAEARNLLASRKYDESIKMLTVLGTEFPADTDIPKLLHSAVEFQKEQRRRQGLTGARSLLAARRYEDCNNLLADLHKQFPNDDEILGLSDAVRADQEEQRKLKGLAEARELLAARRYDDSVAQLEQLAKQFAGDEEIPRMLATAREGQADQRRLKGLADARSLLAAKRYEESIALLKELGKQFPNEREIRKLLATADEERAEQEKQQKLTEARTLLAEQKFAESLALLEVLRATHPKDSAVQKLHKLVQHEQQKQMQQERLQRELESLKKLLNEKKYPEVLARGKALQSDFEGEPDFLRLIEFARTQQAQLDQESRLRKTIEEVKAQSAAGNFAEASKTAHTGLKAFPGNAELLSLRETAETQVRKQQTRQDMELRIREIKVKINREKFSEAVDLAQQSIVTLGPNTDLTQLLNSALVELNAREKKRKQEQALEEIRAKALAGNFDDATMALDEAVQTNLLEPYDPRLQRLVQDIEAAKTASIADAGARKSAHGGSYFFARICVHAGDAAADGAASCGEAGDGEDTDDTSVGEPACNFISAGRASAASAGAICSSDAAAGERRAASSTGANFTAGVGAEGTCEHESDAGAAGAHRAATEYQRRRKPASARPVAEPPAKSKKASRAQIPAVIPVETKRQALPESPAASAAVWKKPPVLVGAAAVLGLVIWGAVHFSSPTQPKPTPTSSPAATNSKPAPAVPQ